MSGKTIRTLLGLTTLVLPALMSAPAMADVISGADTAWMLTSTALVLFMTLPGLSLFYAGLVRVKNVLSVLMQCFALTALMSVLWFVIGYTLAFGSSGVEQGPWIGDLGNLFLAKVTMDSVSGSIPETLFVMFQLTFAVITPALIVGGFAERMRFFRHADFLLALDGAGLCAHLSLGLGWRMAGRNGSTRFCGRFGGAYYSGRCCVGGGHVPWWATGFWSDSNASAQSHDDSDRRRHAVGRLVRV